MTLGKIMRFNVALPILACLGNLVRSERAEFPEWLRTLTEVTDWPEGDPPFVDLPGLDLEHIPDVPQRSKWDCSNVQKEHCSYECHQCLRPMDIGTCEIALLQTFDDGPSENTMDLLDRLESPTTFFVLGVNVVRRPEVFLEQLERGHLVGTHTWNHAYLPALTNKEIAAQIAWSMFAMNVTGEVLPKYFRPPYGATDDRVRAISSQFGLTTVLWDRDPMDWRLNDESRQAIQVLADVSRWKIRAETGIMLEHDSTGRTVGTGSLISSMLDKNVGTVADCVDQEWYQEPDDWSIVPPSL